MVKRLLRFRIRTVLGVVMMLGVSPACPASKVAERVV